MSASVITNWDDRADELAKTCLLKKTGASWMNLCQYCLKMGYFEKMCVPACQIVCARRNRDGFGCAGPDVMQNICDLINSGWSDMYFDGVLTDVSPAEREDVLSWNETMVAQSNEMLAPIIRADIKFQTLAGSHTTLGFRCNAFVC
jgi:hypothetical protein